MKITRLLYIMSGIIILMWVFYLTVYPKINRRVDVTIPDIANMSVSDGKRALIEKNIRVKIIEIEDHNEAIVLYTMPEIGSIVKTKSFVTMYVTRVFETVINDYTNIMYNDVKEDIEEFCQNNNITIKINEVINNNLPEGVIIKQSQEAYKKISSNTLVISVVVHDNKILMPNFVGMNLDDVIEINKEYNLNFLYVYEYSLEPYGTIVGQGVKANTKVLKGNSTEIVIYVSKGFNHEVFYNLDVNTALRYLRCIEYEIIYVNSNLEVNKVIDIDKNLYYDSNKEVIYLYISK